jgi:hypothetical protein
MPYPLVIARFAAEPAFVFAPAFDQLHAVARTLGAGNRHVREIVPHPAPDAEDPGPWPGWLTRISCYTRIMSMKNVTVTLDEETARWARLEAADRDMSVSSLIRQLLRERMGGQAAYAGAMERYLSRPVGRISKNGRYPAREDLHDRAALR